MDFRKIKSLLNYQAFKCDKVENISNGTIKHLKATDGNILICITKDCILNKYTIEKGSNIYNIEVVKTDISDSELEMYLKCKID